MLTRVRLRILALNALLAADTDAKKNVYEYDWPTSEETMPAILINWDKEHKTSVTRTQPNFTTVGTLRLDIRLMGTTKRDTRIAIDKLLWQIEQAILTNFELRKEVQQFVFVTSEGKLDSTTGKHIAHYNMDFGLEYFEDQNQYPPIPVTTLTEIDINVDLLNRFDKTGTYTDAPFPAAVPPAPRTTGPDGRNEGKLVIIIPQD